ncbi:uncharacterized protein LOC100844698 [Brachypodium distachyon]|uniref:Uncharacterized protein n=1 Tax=Brachypodium distachyon TaxID=15368 RepID=A0A0Q3QCM4_BRADI|nr:uncharacterized protein LOC100844698 [Brachypodium distachyon]KQJ99529.1 hypothetical protein BRADI_3g43730v3 [Brachypodium distachyon]|eukprot:XP_003574987.1 uncharacterized protein LOC100844698 [Brachypodium distachyon]
MAFVVLVMRLALCLVEAATLVLLRGLALVVVAVVDLVRLPGQAADAALEATKGALAAAGGFVARLAWDVAAAVVSAFLQLLWSMVASAASAVSELVEAARDGGEEAAKAATEAMEAAADAVAGMVLKMGASYMDALVHAFENLI